MVGGYLVDQHEKGHIDWPSMSLMTPAPITVYIVDDESTVRRALARLVTSARMRAEVFSSVPALIELARLADRACVISDIRMPEVSGLELPGLLARGGHPLPVIFVTAYDSEQNREAARRSGAVAFFHKPIDGQALLDAIAWAVEGARSGTSTEPEPLIDPPNRGNVQ